MGIGKLCIVVFEKKNNNNRDPQGLKPPNWGIMYRKKCMDGRKNGQWIPW